MHHQIPRRSSNCSDNDRKTQRPTLQPIHSIDLRGMRLAFFKSEKNQHTHSRDRVSFHFFCLRLCAYREGSKSFGYDGTEDVTPWGSIPIQFPNSGSEKKFVIFCTRCRISFLCNEFSGTPSHFAKFLVSLNLTFHGPFFTNIILVCI